MRRPHVDDPELGQASDVVAELAAAGFANAVEIGRGGFGVVYRCMQVGLGRVVAVKVLTALSETDRAAFGREQQAMALLTGHPHVVAVLQVGQTLSERPFLVMPLCGRESWHERIAELGALGVDEVLGVGAKLAGALAAAHRMGVVHRDVKPANVLFTDYGEPALTDFGVAYIGRGLHTTTEVIAGTPAFTAPEVISGEDPGPSADVYGLGATLFAALTGHVAIERRHGEQIVAQFVRITSEPVPDLRERDSLTEVAAIIGAAMAPDPSHRPSATELAEQLRQAQPRRHVGGGGANQATIASATPSGPTVGHLPALPAEVVGRSAEVAHLRELLASTRQVTLTGVGGVGKTTLAIYAGAQLRAAYPDGVWLIELSELREGSLLTEAVAAVLKVRDQPGRPLSDVLVGVLAERQALLVLDNCEHLITDVAKFVDLVIEHCPRLHVLATSRGVLDTATETVLAVSPLAVPDTDSALSDIASYPGVALFLQCARAAVPDFTLQGRNASAVARICSRLEGIPLAIELAGARMRAMSAGQIADGLTDRYSLLTRGHRGAARRHRTLAGCIDWSYQLCTQTEQRLWAAFAVFAGSFDLPAAQYVCAGKPLDDDVYALVDKSILIRVQYGDDVRFRLLETLRDYAGTHITQTEQDRLRARHADWYHLLVTDARYQWFSHGQLYWSERLTREMPNIREALQYALDSDATKALEMAVGMRPMWLKSGMFGEARRWLELALDATSLQRGHLRIEALANLGTITFLQGDLAATSASVAEARDLLTAMPDVEQSAKVDCLEGYVAVQKGDIERSAQCFQRALAVVDDFEARFCSMFYLGWGWEVTGQPDEAMTCFESALDFAKLHGESMYQARALVSVGMGHWLRADPVQAEPVLIQGLRVSHLAGDPLCGAQCVETLAWIGGSRHEWRIAAVLMAAADALSRALGTPLLYIPNLIACHEECYRQALQNLGSDRFDAAWADGAALNFDDAVAWVLDAFRE